MIGRRRGRIIIVASGAGLAPWINFSGYAINKCAAIRLAENIAVENRFLEPLHNPVRLWRFCFCFRVVDVLCSQVQLVFVVLSVPTILCAAVSKDSKQRDLVLLEKRNRTIIQNLCSHQCVFSVVQLHKCNLGVCVDKGLLIDSP